MHLLCVCVRLLLQFFLGFFAVFFAQEFLAGRVLTGSALVVCLCEAALAFFSQEFWPGEQDSDWQCS